LNDKLLKSGDVLGGRYEIAGWLGEGGMQQVYRARDSLLTREVALKIPKDAAAEKRFWRSAVVSAKVNHNNVAKTLDYFEENDRPFLIEELIEGCDLGEVREKVVPYLPPQAAARALHQLAKALDVSHKAGVIHRDLKPSNIMVLGGQRLEALKVTDFGIAKMAEEELAGWAEGEDKTATSSKTVLGAIPYMAPESITAFRSSGRPADIWAIGAIVYELMSGKKPFGQGLAAVPAILAAKSPVAPSQINNPQFVSLGEELFKIVLQCLLLDPAKRPSSTSLVGMCEELCYTRDVYEMGSVKIMKNSTYGFLKADEGEDAFCHRQNFYGDNSITVGTRLWFARHKGGNNDRAFPIVKAKA
jgi:serine/threonine-protein kinase